MLSKSFVSWYYNREQYLKLYGEPSDSLMRMFSHEVDCMKVEMEKWNGETINGSTIRLVPCLSDGNDHVRNMFDEFWKDTDDEAASNAPSKVIQKYYEEVDSCCPMDTCFVLGLMTGCLKTDDYEEADQVARMYLRLVDNKCHMEWDTFVDAREAGCKDVYRTDSHAYAVRQMLEVVLSKLAGDEPMINDAIVILDSFYAELMEKFDEGQTNIEAVDTSIDGFLEY